MEKRRLTTRPSISRATPEEIEQLAEASIAGNSDAFGNLYDVFVDQIYRYIFFRVGEQDAEDLTEIVFLKVWENIKQYKRNYTGSNNSASNFSSWIFRIAHNLVVDHYRLQRAQDELTESMQDFSNESSAVFRAHRRLDREALSGAMKQLKDHYKQFIVLKYISTPSLFLRCSLILSISDK